METTAHPGSRATAILQHMKPGESCDIIDLARAIGVGKRQTSKSAAVLIRRGLLTRICNGCYKLTLMGIAAKADGRKISSGPDIRKASNQPKDTFRQRAWSAMKVRRLFTKADIVGDAERDDADASNNVSRFLIGLVAAGYVIELGARKSSARPQSKGFKQYRLVKDTGPHAPVYRKEKQILRDLNTGKDVLCSAR